MTLTAAAVHIHKFDHRGVDNIYRCSCGLSLREYCEHNVYGHKDKPTGRRKKQLKDYLKVKLKEIKVGSEKENAALLNPGHPELLPVPPRPASRHARALKEYYQGNLPQILSDYAVLGDETRKRWGMSDSYWVKLKLENNLPINKHYGKPHTPQSEVKPVAVGEKKATDISGLKETGCFLVFNRYLPVFPEFGECTNTEDRVAWLQTYAELVKVSQVPATAK